MCMYQCVRITECVILSRCVNVPACARVTVDMSLSLQDCPSVWLSMLLGFQKERVNLGVEGKDAFLNL